MNSIKKLVFCLNIAFLSMAHIAQATELTFGGQAGALSAAEGANDTAVGYGAFIQASALDILAIQMDYMGAEINNVDAHAVSPNLLWHLVNFEELRVGIIAGPGFYKLGDDPWRFGLSGGAFGEVSFIKNVPIGLQARYHSVFGGKNNDLWSVFMTIGFRWDILGGDGW